MNSTAIASSGNITPGADNTFSIGTSLVRYQTMRAYTVRAFTSFQGPNAFSGITSVITVRNSAGTGTCTIGVDGGIVYATTC